MFSARRRSATGVNAWPGYVDALSALLMLVIFMLLIFTLAQMFLAQTVSDRDSELTRLNAKLAQISQALMLQETTNADLEQKLTVLRTQYDQALLIQRELVTDINELQETVTADKETIEIQLREKASLQQDIVALRSVREKLENQVGRLSDDVTTRDVIIGSLRDRSKKLTDQLASEQERTLLAQQEIQSKDIRIEDLVAIVAEGEQALANEQELSAGALAQVSRLSQQIENLQSQLNVISDALKLEEQKSSDQQAEIADLGRRLNVALASKVNELEKYRSDFFGRLSEVLVDNPNVRIEGDRFLLPSELLFASASARLGDEGKRELEKLANTLQTIAKEIPTDLNWILRVDGHTDQLPINSERFPSNWELSTARAVEVVKFLSQQGISQNRMAAAGFGEFHPIDPEYSESAFQKNRRIEIKLTNR